MSGTPSRPSTPARLAVPPALRPSSSLSNLRVTSFNAGNTTLAMDFNSSPGTSSPSPSDAPAPPVPPTLTLESSASSIANVEMSESIVKDVDSESDIVDSEDVNVMGMMTNTPATDEESKKSLRDHLRRTLTSTSPTSDTSVSLARRKGKKPEINELSHQEVSNFPPREYFVLTDAGKPVFTSRPEEDALDNLTGAIGVMQALISIFIDDKDKIRCISSGKNRIIFLLRSPLYYVCASSWGEPESVIRSHLEYLHLQILSIVTGEQLRRIFERRSNFDLRRLLTGSEIFLTSILRRAEFNLAMSTSSLHCLRMDQLLRKRIADSMVPSKMKDILYVMLVARGRVVTLIRPKKHSIHPADIHILLNTIHSPSIVNSPAPSTWVPICLPKFNPSGFVNVYISFLRKNDDNAEEPKSPPKTANLVDVNRAPLSRIGSSVPSPDGAPSSTTAVEEDSGIALVCVSAGGSFEMIRGWCDSISQKLIHDGLLGTLALNIRSGQIEYSVSELGVPGLRHFLYKSRNQVQVTMPLFEDPYDDIQERRRLTTLYQILHDNIHAKSGQAEPLKLQYIRTEKESVMGWITQPFELYISLSPRLPKSAVVGAANAVARWVKKEESRLFLRDAPVF